MSDNHSPSHPDSHGAGHDAHDVGGHEIDSMPNRRLFNLLFGLSALTLLCCIGLIQVFNSQAAKIAEERAQEGSFLLRDYQQEMDEVGGSYAPAEGGKFRIPHEKAKQLVVSDPSRLQAFPPPEGWVHPDDLLGAGGAAGAQAPAGAVGSADATDDAAAQPTPGEGTVDTQPSTDEAAGEDAGAAQPPTQDVDAGAGEGADAAKDDAPAAETPADKK